MAPRHRRALLVHRREDRDQPLWRLGVVLEVMLGHGVVREQQCRERRRGDEGGKIGGRTFALKTACSTVDHGEAIVTKLKLK